MSFFNLQQAAKLEYKGEERGGLCGIACERCLGLIPLQCGLHAPLFTGNGSHVTELYTLIDCAGHWLRQSLSVSADSHHL